jgi:hypothetical protein
MKPTISVFLFTHVGDKPHLVNCFNSIIDLKPDEVCVCNTTKDSYLSRDYQNWIKNKAGELDLPIKVGYHKWNGSYKDCCNAALNMCTMDWGVRVDSDEMLTKKLCKDLRDKISSLPPHILVLRPKRISILDDDRCLANLWKEDHKRLPKGSHGRIFKLGHGRYVGSDIHETYQYPGRLNIRWDSPDHPKMDWQGYYIVHLWLYKDNFLRRCWAVQDFPFDKIINELKESGKSKKTVWKSAAKTFLEKRKWSVTKIPKDKVSWVPIEWELNKHWLKKYDDYWNHQYSENIEGKVK